MIELITSSSDCACVDGRVEVEDTDDGWDDASLYTKSGMISESGGCTHKK